MIEASPACGNRPVTCGRRGCWTAIEHNAGRLRPYPNAPRTLDLDILPDLPGIRVTATVKTTGPTGVEMEALTAVSVACLTIYDMLKAAEKAMQITDIRLILKDGGKSGRYEASL